VIKGARAVGNCCENPDVPHSCQLNPWKQTQGCDISSSDDIVPLAGQLCQNDEESSGRSHHVVPVGAYARAHWPVRGRCKLRQRPATRCPWPCNWWGWLCVGRVLTTGTQAPCDTSACTMQRCADSQQASGLCSYFHLYRYRVWKEHFAVAMT